MTAEEQSKVRQLHYALPEGCRKKPASEGALCAFEAMFAAIPADYRWYLAECGGGVVGSQWVDDVEELRVSHLKFTSEEWTMRDVFVIGWDGGGNPMGIDRSTGRVLVEDHQFGGIHVLASSFVDFVLGKHEKENA
jgi:hypothetical protein